MSTLNNDPIKTVPLTGRTTPPFNGFAPHERYARGGGVRERTAPPREALPHGHGEPYHEGDRAFPGRFVDDAKVRPIPVFFWGFVPGRCCAPLLIRGA